MMRSLPVSLVMFALVMPGLARGADDVLDEPGAGIGAPMEVDFRAPPGPDEPLDVAHAPAAGLSAPMSVDNAGLNPATSRTLDPFEGRMAEVVPRPVPMAPALDVFAEQVRGMGITAIDWLAPRVRYASTLPELPEEGVRSIPLLLELVAPPFGVTVTPLRFDGQLAVANVDPATGLPRYARAWDIGGKGHLYAGLAVVAGVHEVSSEAFEPLAPTASAQVERLVLAGRSGVVARRPGLVVAVAPVDEFYAVVAIIDGDAARDARLVESLLKGLGRMKGFDRDAAIAEALAPGAGAGFDFDLGALDGVHAWQPIAPRLSEEAWTTGYGATLSLQRLTGVPSPSMRPLAPEGTSYLMRATTPDGSPGAFVGQVNVAITSDQPERTAALLARALKAAPEVAFVDGRFLLTGLYVDRSHPRKTEYAYRATLSPRADGSSLLTQTFLATNNAQALALHVQPAFDLTLPGLTGDTTSSADGPSLMTMNLAVRRATRPQEATTTAGPRTFASSPHAHAPTRTGAFDLGYGTGGFVTTYEPTTTAGYLLVGFQAGSIVGPEHFGFDDGEDEEGGLDLFAHGRYELPVRLLPELTTEVSAGLHLGMTESFAVGLGVRAAAHYRVVGPLAVWVALQTQHYPNEEVDGTWLAASLGLGYRP